MPAGCLVLSGLMNKGINCSWRPGGRTALQWPLSPGRWRAPTINLNPFLSIRPLLPSCISLQILTPVHHVGEVFIHKWNLTLYITCPSLSVSPPLHIILLLFVLSQSLMGPFELCCLPFILSLSKLKWPCLSPGPAWCLPLNAPSPKCHVRI